MEVTFLHEPRCGVSMVGFMWRREQHGNNEQPHSRWWVITALEFYCLYLSIHKDTILLSDRESKNILDWRRLVDVESGRTTTLLGIITSTVSVARSVVCQLLCSIDQLDGVTAPKVLSVHGVTRDARMKTTYQHSWPNSTPANFQPRALQKDWQEEGVIALLSMK